jgi:hypothetical protein
MAGDIRLLVDPVEAPHVVKDFEGVAALDDGSIEKKKGDPLTHLSDAIGYYIVRKFPLRTRTLEIARV